MSTLRLIPTSGTPIEISKDASLVGRDPACDVVLNDGSVSRRHARLERRGDSWAVVDQGSANGTYVDSHRVTDAPLGDAQELRLGSVTFRTEIVAAIDLSATIGGSDATVVHATSVKAAAPPVPPAPAPEAPKPAPPAASPPPPPPRPAAVAPPPPPPPAASGPPPIPPTSPSRPIPSPVRPMSAPPPPPKKGKGPLFWIATGCFGCLTMVALVVGLIFGGAFFMTRGSVDVVDQFLRDVRQQKLDDAYGRLSESYQGRLSRRRFENALQAHPALKDNAEGRFSVFKGGSVSIVNDRGVVKGTIVSTSGQQERAVFHLVKEGGTWKISAIVLDGSDLSGLAFPGGSDTDVSP